MKRGLAAAAFMLATIAITGCGQKLVPVTGTLTIDGKPVEGASVSFISDDGKFISSGMSAADGSFELTHSKGLGAFPGKYKVTVTKYPKSQISGSAMNTDGTVTKDFEKLMKQQYDKSKGGGKKGGPQGMPMPGGDQGGSVGLVKSELPEVYSNVEKTPLSYTIPTDGLIKIDLKSKP